MDYCDEKYSDEVCEASNEARLPTFDEVCEQENLCRERKAVEDDRSRLLLAVSELGNLRAEMEAKMRAEMEDKMRMEMETKMRMEMEDKMKMEMEDKMEKQKQADEIEVLKNDKNQKIMDDYKRQRANYPTYDYLPIYLKFVQENKVIYSTCELVDHSTGLGTYRSYYWLYISDQRVGVFCISTTKLNKVYLVEDKPFYFFESDLTKEHIHILDQIMDNSTWDNYYNHEVSGEWNGGGDSRTQKPISTLHRRVIGWLSIIQSSRSFGEGAAVNININITSSHMRKFETVIRLIPGGYKNGSWRPLDGFFGVYLDEKTMELSELIPPII
jgi:hypothetical protein